MITIYGIKFANDRVYVGYTKDYETRVKFHLWQLKNNRHTNRLMQENYAICQDVTGVKLDICNSEIADEREIFWINSFGELSLNLHRSLYNKDKLLCKTPEMRREMSNRMIAKCKKYGSIMQGKKHTNDTKRKLSISHTGKQHSRETKEKISSTRARCAVLYVCNGTEKQFSSIREASDYTGISKGFISKILTNKIKRSKYEFKRIQP